MICQGCGNDEAVQGHRLCMCCLEAEHGGAGHVAPGCQCEQVAVCVACALPAVPGTWWCSGHS